MEHYTDAEPIPVRLPGGKPPETIWWVQQMSDDEAAILEASIEDLDKTAQSMNRSITEPGHVRKQQDMDKRTLAGKIARAENLIEPGDDVTDQEVIFDRLRHMSAGRYRSLRHIVIGRLDITLYEKKSEARAQGSGEDSAEQADG